MNLYNAADILNGVVTGGRLLKVKKSHAVRFAGGEALPGGEAVQGGSAFAHQGDLAVEIVRDGEPGAPGVGDLLGRTYLTGSAINLAQIGPELAADDAFEQVSSAILQIHAACCPKHEAAAEYGEAVLRILHECKYSGSRVVAFKYTTNFEDLTPPIHSLGALWPVGPNFEFGWKDQPEVDLFGIMKSTRGDISHFCFQYRWQEEGPLPFQTFLVFSAVERAVAEAAARGEGGHYTGQIAFPPSGDPDHGDLDPDHGDLEHG